VNKGGNNGQIPGFLVDVPDPDRWRGWRVLNNDWVNLVGTLVGAVIAGGLGTWLVR